MGARPKKSAGVAYQVHCLRNAGLDWFRLGDLVQPYLGVVYVTKVVLCWLMAAIGRGLVMRPRLPHGRRWRVMTSVGGAIATAGCTTAGSLIGPVWAKLL